MIERIIRASSQRPLLTAIFALAAALAGALVYPELRKDVFPDLSTPVFNVIVQNPAMGAEELEATIAIPLENALAGLPGTRRMRSSSQLGVAQVTVEFESDADYFRSRQLLAERVQQFASALPEGSEPPLLSSLTGRLNEIMELTLTADAGSADLMTLRDLAEYDLQNRLLAVPGVAAVERLGGYLRQLQVQVDPERMSARGVTLEQVRHALEGVTTNAAGGFVTRGPMEWNVLAVGRAQRPEDIAQIVVAMAGSTPVLVSDVADVREAAAVRRGIAHRLDGEIVSLRIAKQFGADTMQVAAGARAALAEIERGLPPGVHVHIAYDQAELVDTALSGVGRAVLLGALLVIAVLFALLANLRAALLVTAVLPLSLAIAALLLERAGVGLNTMTLGGLAIAVSLLVDASIIVVENAVHRLRGAEGAAERKQRTLLASIEVGRPIVFATLIVVAVFLPLLGMSGIEGRMYGALSWAVIASLVAALALSLTLAPAAAGFVLRPPRPGEPEDVWLVRALKRRYLPALDACLRHALALRVVSLALIIPAVIMAARLGHDLMPELDEGAVLLQTVLPGEASLEQVDRLNHRVEDVLRTFPEVEDVVRRTGRSERTEDPMPHTVSDVLVVLKPERTRSLEALTAAMRSKVEKVPGVLSLFTTPLGMRIDEGLGGTPADLSVRIFGPDLQQLDHLAQHARKIMTEVDGLADERAERAEGLPQLRITLDGQALSRVGLTPGDVMRAVRIGLVGEKISEVYRGQRRMDLVLRLPDDRRADAEAIRALLVDGHDGTRIPLGQLARIEQVFAPAAIRREAGSRRIAIEASVEGRDLGSAAEALRARLARDLPLPPGYFVDVGGRVETQARATRSLLLSIGAALLLVFCLLYVALDSAADALVIVATLPEAFIGAVIALWLAGESWNISSLVGLIGLFGIAVQNGLVLVTQTRALLADGEPFDRALREACVGRVRPKLMTAATAILGLSPLLFLQLPGTEIERPLAIAMTGGLITSTAFTLFALPAFYSLVHDLRQRRHERP